MNLKQYYKSNIRGQFTWKPMTIENNHITVETMQYDNVMAIIVQDKGSFFVRVEGLQHSPFYTTALRKSRITARKLAERLILKDIEKSNTLAVCDLELLAKEG
jgi:hypothetical protein